MRPSELVRVHKARSCLQLEDTANFPDSMTLCYWKNLAMSCMLCGLKVISCALTRATDRGCVVEMSPTRETNCVCLND
jgi:hypothetical protein